MNETLFDADPTVVKTADLSDDGVYRFKLTRQWAGVRETGLAWFVMLNPSTADADDDDPTIQMCMKLARSWGCNGIGVVNLYAYRASQPTVMWMQDEYGVDIIGPGNDGAIAFAVAAAEYDGTPLVAAWGNHGEQRGAPERVKAVIGMATDWRVSLSCLGTTMSGSPKHPLARGKHRIPADQPLVEWAAPA